MAGHPRRLSPRACRSLRRYAIVGISLVSLLIGVQLAGRVARGVAAAQRRSALTQPLTELRVLQDRHARSRMAFAPSAVALGYTAPEGVTADVASLYVDHKPAWFAEVCGEGGCYASLSGRAPVKGIRVPRAGSFTSVSLTSMDGGGARGE